MKKFILLIVISLIGFSSVCQADSGDLFMFPNLPQSGWAYQPYEAPNTGEKVDRTPEFNFQASIKSAFVVLPTNYNANRYGHYTMDNELWLAALMTGKINNNWKYYAEVRLVAPLFPGAGDFSTAQNVHVYDPGTNTAQAVSVSNQLDASAVEIRNAFAYGSALGLKWFVGRFEDNLPFTNVNGRGGLISDSRMDGVRAAWANGNWRGDVFLGGDVNPCPFKVPRSTKPDAPYVNNGFNNQAGISGIDLAYDYGQGNLYFSMYQGYANMTGGHHVVWLGEEMYGPIMFNELGFDYNIAKDLIVTVYGSYTNNSPAVVPNAVIADKTALMARLDYGNFDLTKPGTMNWYGVGTYTPAGTVWTSPNYDTESMQWWDVKPPQPGEVDPDYLAYGSGNCQGFEVGTDWVCLENMDLHLSASVTDPINKQLVPDATASTGRITGARYIYKTQLSFFF